MAVCLLFVNNETESFQWVKVEDIPTFTRIQVIHTNQ